MKIDLEHFYKESIRINPGDINIGRDAPLRVRRHLPGEKAESKSDQQLSESVAGLGLLHPPALMKTEGGSIEDSVVIFGHRRLAAAAKAGLKKISAVVLPAPRYEALEILKLRVEELSFGKELSELERIIAIDKTASFSGLSAEEILPLLFGIFKRQISAGYAHRLLELLKLPDNILQFLHRGDISTGDLLALSEHPSIDPAEAAYLLAGEGLNRGKQKKAVRLMLYLADQGGGKWDKFLSGFRRGKDSLVESLHNACYPVLGEDLKKISSIIKSAGLPKDAVIKPPDNLEGGHFTLRVKIREDERFSGILAKLGKFSEEGGILNLLDILKGKK
ncbi:MAG: ParB N-terminal domain-containing protein [Candidatus Krumholzibacteriota bacterium]|nr:ParB N-terminal domain-containing protein [Candidatus Krumholzibacteriota bacterium]